MKINQIKINEKQLNQLLIKGLINLNNKQQLALDVKSYNIYIDKIKEKLIVNLNKNLEKEIKILKVKNKNCISELKIIKKSKFYRLWQKLTRTYDTG